MVAQAAHSVAVVAAAAAASVVAVAVCSSLVPSESEPSARVGEVKSGYRTESSILSVARQGVSWAQESWFSAGRTLGEEEQAYCSPGSVGKVGVAIAVVAFAVVVRMASWRWAVGWD